MNTIEFINVLAKAGCHPRKSGDGYQARCPAHDDKHPSLSVSSDRENNALVHCHAGCTPTDIVMALGLTMADLTELDTHITSVSLAEVKTERVSWLWYGYIPLGKLTVLDGDPGLGKSTITLDIAARLSTDRKMPDGSKCDLDTVAPTVLITAEDGLGDTVRPRAEAAGADLRYIHAITGVQTAEGDTYWQMPDHIFDLETLVNKKGGKLIIIDPLMAVMSSNVNTYRDQDVRSALKPLADLAERTGAAVVVIRHLNKSSGTNGLYLVYYIALIHSCSFLTHEPSITVLYLYI